MTDIIMLSGWAGTGKDTIANLLPHRKNIKFAEALRSEVEEIYGLPRHLMDHPVFKNRVTNLGRFGQVERLVSPRDLMIEHGMLRREEDPDYWINKAIKELRRTKFPVIFTDWRFKNEFLKVQQESADLDIVTVRLNRLDHPVNNTPSERELDDFPFDLIIEMKGKSPSTVLLEMLVKLYERKTK